eukprot:TRINITY_DN941_c0_g1_i8.p1 TRINITY_DN941_c0_g1~~TRINITY_DN941_c0_g1_i8.p1  ORF type:complete len:1527 (-),score=344.29 TRINITY_DN941_c0_g1_i8:1089-5477(-)
MGSAAARLLTKNHPLLEGLFGAIYVMAKENNLYRFLAGAALFVDFLQILSYLYWPEFHWGVSAFQDALFYSHLDGGSHKVFWFWASLALALFLLLSTVAIQFKRKGAIHSVKLVRILRLVAGATTTILCIPIITALVKPFECMVRGSDADWFSESCYRGEHLAYMIVSILLLLPLAPLILVIAVTYYDPSPTLHHDMLTRSTSRHDAFFIFSKMCMVVSFTLLIDWPAIPALVLGGTSLCLGWMHYRFPPFHLVLLNWIHAGFFMALAVTSLIQLCVIIDESNGIIYFIVSIVALLLTFGGGLWLAHRRSLPLSNMVQDGNINVHKWHHPWDVETSAYFLMPHLYHRVVEEEDPLGQEEDGEEQRFLFDEGCAERLKTIYTRGIRRYPRSTFLRLRFAMFLTCAMGTTESARSVRGQVLRAMKMHRRLDLQFTIYYLRKMWEHEHEVSGMGESKMDIISSIEMQRNLKIATQSHARAKHYIGTFWQLLFSGNTDPEALASVIEKIERYEVNAQRAYAKLISRFPNSVKVLREYGTFCSEVKNDQETSHQVFALADQLEEEQSKVGRTRTKRRGSTHGENEDERHSLCSADWMSGCDGGSCTGFSEASSRSLGRFSFIQHSRIRKPPQIRMLSVKLWIVLVMILAVVITMAVLSHVNVGFYRDTTTHMVEVLGGQTSAQRVTLYLAIMRADSIPLPPFGPGQGLGAVTGPLLPTRIKEFRESMHSAYPRRFSHYGFNGLKKFWEREDLCTQVYVGNGQYTEECMNYWEAVTRFLAYAAAVQEKEGSWDAFAPYRWIADNSNTVIQKHGVMLADVILEEEEYILSIHFTTMLCFTIGSCAVTILAMAFFIRPAVVTIRDGRDAMLSLFQGIPRDILRQRCDFYNGNGEEKDTLSMEFSSDHGKRKWNSLHISLLATGVICVLIVISGVVSITLLDGLSARSIRCMGSRQVAASQTMVGSMEVLYNDGVRAMTLEEAIENLEEFVSASASALHSLKFGCTKHHSPPLTSNKQIAEMMYEKLSDKYPRPMDSYMRVFIDSMQQTEREARAAYPTQLTFMESEGFVEMLTVASAIADGSAYLTQTIMDSSQELNGKASTTILAIMILALVLIVVVYYVVLIQYVVRRLYHESQRTMRMFLLLPEEAITQSNGLRHFLESNGTNYGTKKGLKGVSKSDKMEGEGATLREALLTVDSSGLVRVANDYASYLFGYGGDTARPWPHLDQLMSDVDLSGPDRVALRTDAHKWEGNDPIRVMYDLHHWGDLVSLKVRRCHVKDSKEGVGSSGSTEGIMEMPPSLSASYLRSELLRLSGKPLMLLDADGFPEAAQDELLHLLGYSCVDDLPHIRSLFPHIPFDEEGTDCLDRIATEVVCHDGSRKRVYMDYRRRGECIALVPMECGIRSVPLLLEGEHMEKEEDEVCSGERGARIGSVLDVATITKIQPLSPKNTPHLPPLTFKKGSDETASAV